jgi:hypothetical protein
MCGQEIVALALALAYAFGCGYTLGEWAEERRRNREWWAARKDRP